MRPIKFRQWISTHNKPFMHYGIGIVKEGHWSGPPDVNFSVNPIMQFTGLLDKNGKEIFENDIVNFTSKDLDAYDWAGKGVITWDSSDTGYFIDSDIDKWPHIKLWFAINIEVIGNIWENPTFLEGK